MISERLSNYKFKVCDQGDCSGCDQFLRQLLLSEKGRDAIRSRFDGMVSHFEPSFFRICAKKTGATIPSGVCDSVLDESDKTAEIGCIVNPDDQGLGIGRLLGTMMLGLLKERGIRQIRFTINSNNLRSIRLAEGIGAISDVSSKYGVIYKIPL